MNILGKGQFFVVSSYLQQLQSYLKYLDLPLVELLKNSDLPLFTLSQPNLYLGHESIADINKKICTLVPSEADLIKYLATERDALAHGSLGIAAVLSLDLENAILLIQKYIRTRHSGMKIEALSRGEFFKILLTVPKTNSYSERLTVLSTLLAFESGLRKMLVVDTEDYPVIINVTCSRPDGWTGISSNTMIQFDQPRNSLAFPKKLLKKHLIFSDQHEFSQAQKLCDLELKNIEALNDLSEVVKSKLSRATLPLPNIEVITSDLNISVRTLRRRLEGLGIQYIDLKQEVLNTKALELLSVSDLSLQQISWELGYSDYKSFSRSFKKLKNLTPSQYRKNLKARLIANGVSEL